MALCGYHSLTLLLITLSVVLKVEGGWKPFKKNLVKKACYSASGARRFIQPPSVKTCLVFCRKYGFRFCEFGKQDGFCYGKDTCTKMRQSTSNRVLDVYIFTKGNTKFPNRPQKPNQPENPSNPKKTNTKNKPSKPATDSKGKPKQTRDPLRPLTVKMGILVASDLADAFYSLYGISNEVNKEDILKAQVLTNYLTGLNTDYSDKSLGNLKVKVVFTHFSVVSKSTWRQWTDVYSFCKSSFQTALTDVDVVMYLVKNGGSSSKGVKLTSAGRSITSGICKLESRCGMVNEVASVDTAYRKLTAHELGHVIGLIDDGPGLKSKLRRSRTARNKATKGEYPYDDMRCDGKNVQSVMSGKADVWSVCSKDRFKTVFGSDLSSCLDTPAKSPILPEPSDLIGQRKKFTRKEMCEQLQGQDPTTASWSVHYQKPAKETECKFFKGECYVQAPSRGGRFAPMKMFDDVPFMQGAKCHKGCCYFGECLSGDEIITKMKKMMS